MTGDLEHVKHEQGGTGDKGGWLRPNDDAESRVQQRGRPDRRASHLLNTCKVGLSYVHNYLHNHNIVLKIYISADFLKRNSSPHSCFNMCEASHH